MLPSSVQTLNFLRSSEPQNVHISTAYLYPLLEEMSGCEPVSPLQHETCRFPHERHPFQMLSLLRPRPSFGPPTIQPISLLT